MPAIARIFRKDQAGGSTVQFALLFLPLLLLVIGIIELSFVAFEWNMAEKTTQLGVRKAAIWDPVAPQLKCPLTSGDKTGCKDTSFTAGQALTLSRLPAFEIICSWSTKCNCSGSGCATLGDPRWDGNAFTQIVTEMRRGLPGLPITDVVIRYRHIGLGFAGRPGGAVVPAVTVELQNQSYQSIALGTLLRLVWWFPAFGQNPVAAPDLGSIPLPPFTATLTGEDLATNGGAS